jgi:peptidoglycan/LPS O-acetylase OafA/YrhL
LSTEPSLSTAHLDNLTDQPARAERDSRQGTAFYRPELDVLRFFAFLCVFLTHGVRVNLKGGVLAHHRALGLAVSFLNSAGSYGLPLFFFLSSFLITTLLLLEKGETGRIHLRSFYIRRVLRIWPLYFGFLTVTYLVGLVWKHGHFSAHALLAFFLISGNWYVIEVGYLAKTMTLLWSISVEEQFYLIWPTCVRSLSPQGIQRFCVFLFFASLSVTALLAASHSTLINIWYNSGAQMIFFAGGGILAVRVGLIRQNKNALQSAAALLVGTGCWLVADAFKWNISNNDLISAVHAVPSYFFMCAGCAAFLWGFLHMPKAALHPKLVYLGRISYGLYVFQGVGLILGSAFIQPYLKGGLWLPFSFVITILLAILSYEFYEKPFLKLKRRFELVHSRPA